MTVSHPRHILRLDSSMRTEGSFSRDLTDRVMARLAGPQTEITVRDLAAETVPAIDAEWIGANFTDPAERSEAQRAKLAHSDRLVAELKAADTLVIGVPVYNFSVSAALKAWIDQVVRARETFRYTAEGPEGLLTGKRAVLVIASGGTPLGSGIDFATGYLHHILGFLGFSHIDVVNAGELKMDEPAARARAEADIAALAA